MNAHGKFTKCDCEECKLLKQRGSDIGCGGIILGFTIGLAVLVFVLIALQFS